MTSSVEGPSGGTPIAPLGIEPNSRFNTYIGGIVKGLPWGAKAGLDYVKPLQRRVLGNTTTRPRSASARDEAHPHRLNTPMPTMDTTSIRSPTYTKLKSRRDLELLEKPVHIIDLEGSISMLPQDVRSLYSHIQKARHKEDIIPFEIRDQVIGLVGEDEARPYYFRKEATPGAEAMHNTLYEVILEAKEAVRCEYHETGWNNFVHTPLLKLVYPSRTRWQNVPSQPLQQPQQLGGARVVSVTSATIWDSYIPIKPKLLDPAVAVSLDADSESGASGSFACSVSVDSVSDAVTDPGSAIGEDVHSRSNSNKVDYILAMDIGHGAPFQKALSLHLRNEAIGRGLIPHVNQTLYPSLQYSPIACSIETKVAIAVQDPMLQLGIWIAAWHKRMHILRRYLFSKVPSRWHSQRQEERLPSTLLIEVVNHHWQLYFACDRGTRVDIFGPLSIGSTGNIADAYVLIASLKAIKDWVETIFHTGVEKWCMCNDSDEIS